MKTSITPTLDKIEERLPPIPKGLFKLNRTVTRTWCQAMGGVIDAVSSSGGRVSGTATTAVRTAAGQAKAEAGQAVDAASTGAKTVAGQAGAQAERAAEVAREEALDLIESADEAIDSATSEPYETWTRSELYARAQELDIEGRSGMKKAQLVAALRQST